MKIQYMSDLHLEFLDSNEIEYLIDRIVSQTDTEVDTLILAGDIGTINSVSNERRFFHFLTEISERFQDVIHVPGNHEYYGTEPFTVKQVLKGWDLLIPNYTFLDNETYVLENGTIVAGTSLWFDSLNPACAMYRDYLNDYRAIPGFDNFVLAEQAAALRLLNEFEPNVLDVLVTHHSPTKKPSPKFINHPANIFYHTDLEKELVRLQPKIVIHGHIHEPMDYWVYNTHVMSNPGGYGIENPKFDPLKIVDV